MADHMVTESTIPKTSDHPDNPDHPDHACAPDHADGPHQVQGPAPTTARHLPTLRRDPWMPPPPPSPPAPEDFPSPPPLEEHPEWPWVPEDSIRGLLWELSDDPDKGGGPTRGARQCTPASPAAALGRRWPAPGRARAAPAPVPEVPRPALLQGEQWTPHGGGPRRVEPCAARQPHVEPPEPARALPVRATFGTPRTGRGYGSSRSPTGTRASRPRPLSAGRSSKRVTVVTAVTAVTEKKDHHRGRQLPVFFNTTAGYWPLHAWTGCGAACYVNTRERNKVITQNVCLESSTQKVCKSCDVPCAKIK